MLGESTGLKLLAGGLSGGVVYALLEGATPPPVDPTTMMYSLAVAVIALATLAIKNRRSIEERPIEKVSNSVLLSKLEDFVYGPTGVTNRIDKLADKVDTLSHEIGFFRETTVGSLADHRARISGLEQRRGSDVPHNAAGFGG